jgi:peroxiredoxin
MKIYHFNEHIEKLSNTVTISPVTSLSIVRVEISITTPHQIGQYFKVIQMKPEFATPICRKEVRKPRGSYSLLSKP